MRGLLDSGASESLLGRGCRELAEELNLPVKPYVSTMRTASGEDRSIIGRLVFPVEYKGEVKDDDGARSEPETWVLDESQKLVLEEVKAKFLAFEKVGLGKTHAEKHRIELVAGAQPVKDRHYPLSPAMQQVVWDEVDKMLAIGVIEESNSPWSNRTTVGVDNVVADTLSRSLGAEVADLQGAEFDPSEVLGFQTNEFQSGEYQELVREVMENKESLPELKVEGGAIFKKIMVNRLEEELDGSTWKLWVPASLTHELVRRAHSGTWRHSRETACSAVAVFLAEDGSPGRGVRAGLWTL
ncbi:hypothetical protein ACLKA7_005606 [Drosophila subpalustris]